MVSENRYRTAIPTRQRRLASTDRLIHLQETSSPGGELTENTAIMSQRRCGRDRASCGEVVSGR